MIATYDIPHSYALEVYQLQAALRRRRRERAASPSQVPHSRLPQALRDELDAVAAVLFARDPMPIPTDKEISMHLQLVNPEPDQTPDVTPPAAPEPTAPGQPLTRAEWRALVEARCRERNITLNRACAEIGCNISWFAPSALHLSAPAATTAKIAAWLGSDIPVPTDNPQPIRPQLDRALRADMPPAGARPARRYPAITVEPSAMPLDDLVEYLARLRDLMPGATVTWPTAITISMES